MHMVADAAGLYHRASRLVDELADVCVYPLEVVGADLGAGGLDVEDQVDIDFT